MEDASFHEDDEARRRKERADATGDRAAQGSEGDASRPNLHYGRGDRGEAGRTGDGQAAARSTDEESLQTQNEPVGSTEIRDERRDPGDRRNDLESEASSGDGDAPEEEDAGAAARPGGAAPGDPSPPLAPDGDAPYARDASRGPETATSGDPAPEARAAEDEPTGEKAGPTEQSSPPPEAAEEPAAASRDEEQDASATEESAGDDRQDRSDDPGETPFPDEDGPDGRDAPDGPEPECEERGEEPSIAAEPEPTIVHEAPTAIELERFVDEMPLAPPAYGEETTLSVRLGGEAYKGDPRYEIVVDGEVVASGTVDWARETTTDGAYGGAGGGDVHDDEVEWRDIEVPITIPHGGVGEVEVRFPNDAYKRGVGDRNLIVDRISIGDHVIEAESEHVEYDGNRHGSEGRERMAWRGSLKFDTSSAFEPQPQEPPEGAFIVEGREGVAVGRLTVIDPDAEEGEGHVFAVSDERFEVKDGVLKLKDGETLNFEDAAMAPVEVTATDADGGSVTETFEIEVVDVYEGPPPSVGLSSGFKAEYFDVDHGLSQLSDLDWSAEPDHAELIDEIDYKNGSGSFWEGGAKDTFGTRVTGVIDVEEGGEFTFHLSADDGAHLYIDGVRVIDHDGLHAYRTDTGAVELSEGPHAIEIRYFENRGHAGLKLEWEGPGVDGRETLSGGEAEELSTLEGVPLNLSLDVDFASGGGSVAIEALPPGAVLSAGDQAVEVGADGAADLTGWDLDLLTIRTPIGFEGEVEGRVHAVDDNGAETTFPVEFTVAPAPEPAIDIQMSHGFRIEFFEEDRRLSELDDIDWSSTPDHEMVASEINFANSRGAFREGGDRDTFGVRATGEFTVEEGGVYDFRLGADDGAALYINGVEVVENDGLHGFRNRDGEIELEPGVHEIEVRYFENYGRAGLKLQYDGPDTDGFEFVQANDELAGDVNEPLFVDLSVDAAGGAVHEVAISGLPDDTFLMSGDDFVRVENGEADLSGWNLEALEISPPTGFSGVIEAHVEVSGEAFNGAPFSSERTFEIRTGDDFDEGRAQNGVELDPGQFGDGDGRDGPVADDGWTEAAASEEATEDEDERVLDENVEQPSDSDSGGEQFETYERTDW